MADVGMLAVKIGMDHSDLEKGVGKSQSLISGLVGQADKWGAMFSNPWTAAAAVSVAAIAGVGVALVAIGKAAFDFASEVDSAMGRVQAQLGLTESEMLEFKGVALDVWKTGVGDNIDQVAGSMAFAKQTMEGLNDVELGGVVTKATAISDAFGDDVNEVIRTADTLMEQYGITATEAFDRLTVGYQQGLNSGGDLLDTLGEYSNQLANMGFSAQESFSLLDSLAQGGVLALDKGADSLKEFGIRILDNSALTRDSLAAIGIDADAMYAQMNAGALTQSDVFEQVIGKLAALDNKVLQNTAGVGLFGTQWEDSTAKAILGADTQVEAMQNIAGAADGLNVQYDTLGNMVEVFRRRAVAAILPIGDALLTTFKTAMPQVERVFSWFEATGAPMIQEFATKSTEVLVKFFGNFDQKFGPSIRRIEESLLMVSTALGLTGQGASGLDAIVKLLEVSLNAIAFVVDKISLNIKVATAIATAFITPLRMLYDLIKNIISIGGSIIGGIGTLISAPGAGFAEGGSFVVPPGFPNDSFPIGVSSGEFVDITPANQVNDNRQFIQNIHTRATQENVAMSYQHMVAAMS